MSNLSRIFFPLKVFFCPFIQKLTYSPFFRSLLRLTEPFIFSAASCVPLPSTLILTGVSSSVMVKFPSFMTSAYTPSLLISKGLIFTFLFFAIYCKISFPLVLIFITLSYCIKYKLLVIGHNKFDFLIAL